MSSLQRTLIGIAFTFAPAAMGVAMFLAGYSQTHPAWWQAAVHLAVLGGITIMIYGVNINALPTNSGRQWKSEKLVARQLFFGILGAVVSCLGYGFRNEAMIVSGHIFAFIAAVLFMVNIRLLFSQPGRPRPAIPAGVPIPPQRQVDKLAVPFTRISSMVLIIATGLDIALDFWTPAQGRWDLVWGHLMLVGFFFAMASGTSYHTLARWSGTDFPYIRLIRVHRISYLLALPAMAIALGWDIDWLFMIGGPMMALAFACWAINVVPVAWKLKPAMRSGIVMALLFMIVGVSLGVSFALDPALGPRLRSAHVMANLFGFAGLLISGFGYYYIPKLAGFPTVRWRLLTAPHLVLVAVGCAAGIVLMGLRMYGHIEPETVMWATVPAAAGMLIFATNAAGTFAQTPAVPVD